MNKLLEKEKELESIKLKLKNHIDSMAALVTSGDDISEQLNVILMDIACTHREFVKLTNEMRGLITNASEDEIKEYILITKSFQERKKGA